MPTNSKQIMMRSKSNKNKKPGKRFEPVDIAVNYIQLNKMRSKEHAFDIMENSSIPKISSSSKNNQISSISPKHNLSNINKMLLPKNHKRVLFIHVAGSR